MKNTNKKPKVRFLTTAVTMALSVLAHQTAGANDYKHQRIGDLEIYQAAKNGQVTLMMMLDTSGSMSDKGFLDGEACEIPSSIKGIVNYTPRIEQSGTTPSYEKYSCVVDRNLTKKVYAHTYVPYYDIYYTCDVRGVCNTRQYTRGKPAGYDRALKESITMKFDINRQAYKTYTLAGLTEAEKNELGIDLATGAGLVREDRLTRLKNALFELMNDRTVIDPSKVAIGIGQYSTQSDANNTAKTADGRTGKILVPAALMDDAQRAKIKVAVAGLVGSGGTPSASAYAEAGAYMLGTTTRSSVTGMYSGFNDSITSSKNGSKYISPMPSQPVTCDGNGIYFLTDGEPNSSVNPAEMMKQALGTKGSTFRVPAAGNGTLPNGTQSGHGTPDVGAFAKALRVASNNPSNVSIRTAVVGFGSVFDVRKYEKKGETDENKKIRRTLPVPELNKAVDSMPIPNKFSDKSAVYFNCELITAVDAKNACNWGAKSHPSLPNTVGGYGEGGFYSAQESKDVVDSVKTFLDELNNEISATPSGTISIPSDPLNALTIQPYAYVPMLHPQVGKDDAVWNGNLKRYHTLYGTLYGKNRQRLYKPNPAKATTENNNFPVELNETAYDLWQEDSSGNAADIDVGGSRSQVVKKDTENAGSKTSRVVYIEGGTATAPKIIKAQIVNGRLQLNGSTNYAFPDFANAKYSIRELAALVNYLGFAVPMPTSDADNSVYGAGNFTSKITALHTQIASVPMSTKPVFGGVGHSVPVLAAYKGQFNVESGNIDSTEGREDYLLYGTMEGSLRMVTATKGEEKFAFIPRTIFKEQAEALAPNSKGTLRFGVDAPWAVSAKYKTSEDDDGKYTGVSLNTDLANGGGMYAYGGLRMGGVGIYGLNITNPASPSLAFAITDKSTGFERLGQTWVKPTLTQIKQNGKAKDVLVFGGGYDMCYENPNFELGQTHEKNEASCNNKAQAQGNAIYMIDARTGEQIAKWQSDGSTSLGDVADMKHSFVGEMVALDRNNNGFVDSIYASDLGGQLFRIDLREGASNANLTRRVVKVFDANDESGLPAGTPPLRFYEKPSVSFYDHDGGTLAMVNIASGDRSSPLHKYRDNIEKANRIYGIIDRDLPSFRIGQAGNGHLISHKMTHKALHKYDTAQLTGSGAAANNLRKRFMDNLKSKPTVGSGKYNPNTDAKGIKHGWWYPMTRFDRYTEVKHLKAIGSSMVSGSIFYTSIYNPDYQYTKEEQCSARVVGSTERQMFCLPWGICANNEGVLVEESRNGTLGFAKAGPGIQELAMTTLTDTEDESTSFRSFVSQQTMFERAQEKSNTTGNHAISSVTDSSGGNGVKGGGGSNIPPGPINNEMKKVLKVNRWYDLANAESGQ